MKVFEVPADRQIVLPKKLFKPTDRVAIVNEGGMVIIKKVETPRLSSLAGRVKDRPLSMRAIGREVRAYRRSQRAR